VFKFKSFDLHYLQPNFLVYLVNFMGVPVNFLFNVHLLLKELVLSHELEELIYLVLGDWLLSKFCNALFRTHPLVLVQLVESPE